MSRIGVLSLQGGFEAHSRILGTLGVDVVDVRRVAALRDIDGLVLPGGESTTLLKLMEDEPWFAALREFHGTGKPLFATCAGAILLAREVVDPSQLSLGLLDAKIRRNGFGRQIDSFETLLTVVDEEDPVRAVFIRAPRFVAVGPRVDVLARLDGEPVLVQEGHVLAATFHPELTQDCRLHRRFVKLAVSPQNQETYRAEHVLAG